MFFVFCSWQKRTRVQIRANDIREMSLNEDEREESSDDFEESRPRAKRNKATASTSAAAPITDQTLIGIISLQLCPSG